jgi:hypothetical protein
MKRRCECGNLIKVYIKGKGWTGAPDREHDYCKRCWESQQDSTRLHTLNDEEKSHLT